ncbi:MAG: LysE family transporter [Spirochaetaceae bacterium]|nr:LysE family transporter [Spirochaetaceae bacterium]
MLEYVMEALALGFAAGAQPGAMQAYLIARATCSGWRHALPAAFAPLLSDGPAIIASTALLVALPTSFQRVLSALGGIFLLWLARGAFVRWRSGDEGSGALDGPKGEARAGILQAVAINLFNPAPFLFWSLVSGPILLRAWSASPWLAAAFLCAFYLALVGVNAAIVLVFGFASSRGERLRRALQGLSILAMLAFGIMQLARAAGLV